MTAILAVRDAIVGVLPSVIPPRCGISVCGATRLGIGTECSRRRFDVLLGKDVVYVGRHEAVGSHPQGAPRVNPLTPPVPETGRAPYSRF